MLTQNAWRMISTSAKNLFEKRLTDLAQMLVMEVSSSSPFRMGSPKVECHPFRQRQCRYKLTRLEKTHRHNSEQGDKCVYSTHDVPLHHSCYILPVRVFDLVQNSDG